MNISPTYAWGILDDEGNRMAAGTGCGHAHPTIAAAEDRLHLTNRHAREAGVGITPGATLFHTDGTNVT